jgi:hypothetical protein
VDRHALPYDDRFVLACAHLALEYRRRVADADEGDLRVATAASRWSTGSRDFTRLANQMLDALDR